MTAARDEDEGDLTWGGRPLGREGSPVLSARAPGFPSAATSANPTPRADLAQRRLPPHRLLLAFALLCLPLSVAAAVGPPPASFASVPRPDRRHRPSRRHVSSSLGSAPPPVRDDNDDDDAPAVWSMAEDWALIDAVRTHTVVAAASSGGERRRRYTFWGRAAESDPSLRSRTAVEARERYGDLLRRSKEDDDGKSEDVGEERRRLTDLTDPGRDPALLSGWRTFSGPGADTAGAGMGGLLEDGREIWFPLVGLGRFPAPGADEAPSGTAVTGGYAEAAGGIVYELGYSRPVEEKGGLGRETAAAAYANLVGEPTSSPPILFQTATAALVALGAASLLAAAIGFGAGMALQTKATGTATLEQYKTTSVMMQRDSARGGRAAVERSVSEMRARQELRVVRERKALVIIEGKIGGDEAKLDELRRDEVDPTASYDGDTKVEMRAKQEMRVLREKREIKAINGFMRGDEARLDELKQMERNELGSMDGGATSANSGR